MLKKSLIKNSDGSLLEEHCFIGLSATHVKMLDTVKTCGYAEQKYSAL